MKLLSICDLSYAIGSNKLLDSISLELARGGYTIIVGQNGAGKTTLLKCIARILTNWTGSVLFEGRSIRTMSLKKTASKIAFVRQSSNIRFSFTVRQIVEMGRYPHQGPFSAISGFDAKIVDKAMEELGITHFEGRELDTLSGGERQKVMLAAALAQEPDLLLLDEPTTYLDYRHQAEIGAVLRRINNNGTTILEVTHDVNRAVLDGQHVLAIGEGKVLFDGKPDVFMQPETLREIYGIDFQLVDHPNHPLKMIVPGV